MKTMFAILLLSSVVWGQTVHLKPDADGKCHWSGPEKPDQVTVCDLPLHCGKYQHEQKTAAHCASQCPDGVACVTSCLYVPESDECVDDIHFVTEAEWQAIMKRLDELKPEDHGCPAPTRWMKIPITLVDPNPGEEAFDYFFACAQPSK